MMVNKLEKTKKIHLESIWIRTLNVQLNYDIEIIL